MSAEIYPNPTVPNASYLEVQVSAKDIQSGFIRIPCRDCSGAKVLHWRPDCCQTKPCPGDVCTRCKGAGFEWANL